MSGIVGIVDFSGLPAERAHLEMMTQKLSHRGPDGIHHWLEGSVGLGHCMLHTTAESLTEQQPLVNTANDCTLVMDGRIDNWEELRLEFKRPHANDVELVMLAYDAWGDHFPSRLEGDFAIALWDQRRELLLCCRDIFGMRPFYYHWDGRRFSFASELGPLRALPWVATTLNEGTVAEYLGHEWYSLEETFWCELKRLRPRHTTVVTSNGLRATSYWEPELFKPLKYASDSDYVEHYRELIESSVRRISRSHLPIACEVSGGLDSSAIYVLAHHLLGKGRLLAPAMHGYTLAFPPGTPADELAYARAVAEHTNTRIEECTPTYQSLQWYRDRATARGDIPDIPNGSMFMGLLQAASSRSSRVLINGQGGDEWTGHRNYGRYYADFISTNDWSGFRRAYVHDWEAMGQTKALWWVLRYGFLPLLPPQIRTFARSARSLISYNRPPDWLTPHMRWVLKSRRNENMAGKIMPSCYNYSQRGLLHYLTHAITVWTNELSEYRNSSLQIEARSPYYNKRIVQFALSTNEWTRQRGMRHRWLHREAIGKLLPQPVLNRQGKADFTLMTRNTNDEIRDQELASILARRPTWVDSLATAKLAATKKDLAESGIEEGILWYLACCDAVANQ